jgi:predicted amidophosphoribosyltransferase
MNDYEKNTEKEECPNCGRMVKQLDDDNGICKRCMSEYE